MKFSIISKMSLKCSCGITESTYHQVEREIKTTEAAINIQDPKWDDEEILHVHIENEGLSNYYTKSAESSSKRLMNKKFDLEK